MLNINNTLIAGGDFTGGRNWNKEASTLDNCFKLYYIENGEAYLYSESGEFKMKAGDVCFINGFHIKKQYCPYLFKVSWLHFMCDSILIKQVLLRFPVLTKLKPDEIKPFLSGFKQLDTFFRENSSSQKGIQKKRMSRYFKIQALLQGALSVLLHHNDHKVSNITGYQGRLYRAIDYIDTNYKKSISLKTLADLSYMSENYFHTLFKKEFTVSPYNYILQLRMNDALNLLSNTSLSVKEIAIETGYTDAAYFSRTFARYFSLSPNKYRNLHRTRTP